MSPERWRRVEEVFETALALPEQEREAYLAEACGADDELRREVEAMLAADAEAESSLESGAADLGAAILFAGPIETDRNIGRRVGNYKIIGEIGRGGMGAVYEAARDDAEFQQRVALKLIKRGMDTDFILRRFRHERQILANLNHPFIARLLDGGTTDDGLPFFVMEFVEGEPLDRYCRRNDLSLNLRLRLFEKVCSAVAHAHKRGIVHRDIKPGNILVTPEGEVKLLDFGIAKILTPDNTPDTIDAMTGRLMTPEYASPEQIRGLPVAPGSDVYSLGVLLYQLSTGKHPYKTGNSAPHELARAICEENPVSPSSLVNTPSNNKTSNEQRTTDDEQFEELDKIVFKAMRKQPDERYPTAAELADDISRFLGGRKVAAEAFPAPHTGGFRKQHKTGFANATTVLIKPKKSRLLVPILSLLLLICLGAAAGFWFYRKSPGLPADRTPNLFSAVQVARLTTNGLAFHAAISPDGSLVSFISESNGLRSVWVKPASSPNPTRIIAETESKISGLSFSPDGAEIFYISQAKDSDFGTLYRIPATGGESRKVLDDVSGKISFSPDGGRFVFTRDRRGRRERILFISDANGTDLRQIAERRYPDLITNAEWSPDGKTIAFCTMETFDADKQTGTVQLFAVETGETKRLGEKKWGYLTSLAWQPDSGAVFVTGQDNPKSHVQIWRVNLADAKIERVTNDADDYRGISVARREQSLVTVKTELHSEVWVAPFGGAALPNETSAKRLVENNVAGLKGLDWTPDGKIIYTTDEESVAALWRTDADGSNRTRLSGTDIDRFLPVAAPDNRYLVYVAGLTEKTHLRRMNSDGTAEIDLAADVDEKFPQITPDGKWIVFTQTANSKPTLAKVSIEGGKVVSLGETEAMYPAISPDGSTIAFLLIEPTGAKIALMPIEGGAPTRVFPTPIAIAAKPFFSSLLRFAPDGKAIGFIKNERGVSNIFSQPLDGKPVRQLTNFTKGEIFYFDFSNDGSQLALARGSQTSDVIQINLPK